MYVKVVLVCVCISVNYKPFVVCLSMIYVGVIGCFIYSMILYGINLFILDCLCAASMFTKCL